MLGTQPENAGNLGLYPSRLQPVPLFRSVSPYQIVPSSAPKSTAIYQLMLHGIVVLWGLTAILGKGITLEKPLLVAWRTGLAALGVLILLMVRKTPWPRAADAWKMTGVGVIIGVHWVFFFLPGKMSTISAGLVGLSTISLWCALFEPLFDKEKRVGMLELGLSLGVLSGAACIGYHDQKTIPGLLVGVAAAITAAVFAIFNGRLVQKFDAFQITFFEMLGACGFTILLAAVIIPPGTPLVPSGQQDWLLLILLSQLCTVLAFSACTWLQKRLSVYQIGLASNLEPVYGVLLAAAIYKEHQKLQPSFWLGGAIIIACVMAYPPLNRRLRR